MTIHALAIHGSQTKTTDAGRGHSPTRCGDVKRQSSTYEHRKTSAARSSLSPRHLGRGFGSGRFLRSGWGCALNDLATVRALRAAGVDELHAVQLVANQFGHQLAVQASADLPEIHLSVSTSARSTNASTTSRKRFADEQNPCVSGAKID